MFQIDKNRLNTDEGVVFFEHTIREAIKVSDVIIIRLEVMGGEISLNNVYGVKGGRIIWQVQDMREYNPKLDNPIVQLVYPYGGIDPYEKDRRLVIGNAGGFRYLIDPTNGKIVGEESWVK